MKNPPSTPIASTASVIPPPRLRSLLQALLDLDPRLDVRDLAFDSLDDHVRTRGQRSVVDPARAQDVTFVANLEHHFSINVGPDRTRHTGRMSLQDVTLVVRFMLRGDLPPIPHETRRDDR